MSGRPGQDIPVTIHANAWSAGCLSGLLRRQIIAVETQIRICGGDMTPEAKGHCSEYRDQLCAMQDAVEQARRSPLRPSTEARDEEAQGEDEDPGG